MLGTSAARLKRSIKHTAIWTAATLIVVAVVLVLLWRDRESLDGTIHL